MFISNSALDTPTPSGLKHYVWSTTKIHIGIYSYDYCYEHQTMHNEFQIEGKKVENDMNMSFESF